MSRNGTSILKRTRAACALVISGILCLLLCSCTDFSSDEQVVNYAIKYSSVRTELDMSDECVIESIPDARIQVSSLGITEKEGTKDIKLEPSVVSNTIAGWSQDAWAENWDDLYFNFSAHFQVVCKQAHEYSDVPESYSLSCPDYMVVYDETRERGVIVDADGVYRKTENSDNPRGEAIVLSDRADAA